jgi:hypothetical protein
MALNLEILGRIGTYLGFGRDRADCDAQERSKEHNTSQTGYSEDEHRGPDDRQDEAAGNHSKAGNHGVDGSQNSANFSTDIEYQISTDVEYQNNDHTYGGSYERDFDPPPSGMDYVGNNYRIDENGLDNDEGDLHAVLAALPDTGAMLDAAISYLDSGIPSNIGSVDTPFDDHGGSSSIT